MLDSSNPDSWWQWCFRSSNSSGGSSSSSPSSSSLLLLHLPPLPYHRIITAMYLKLSLTDVLTLFSARSLHRPFFSFPPPTLSLLLSALLATTLSLLLSLLLPHLQLNGTPLVGFLWGEEDPVPLLSWYIGVYCVITWLVQDAFKVTVFALAHQWGVLKQEGSSSIGGSTMRVVRGRKMMEGNRKENEEKVEDGDFGWFHRSSFLMTMMTNRMAVMHGDTTTTTTGSSCSSSSSSSSSSSNATTTTTTVANTTMESALSGIYSV